MPPVYGGLAVHSVGGQEGRFQFLPEVLLHGLVVLQLPLDVLKLSLQVSVAHGNKRVNLILTTLLAGPRLN